MLLIILKQHCVFILSLFNYGEFIHQTTLENWLYQSFNKKLIVPFIEISKSTFKKMISLLLRSLLVLLLLLYISTVWHCYYNCANRV